MVAEKQKGAGFVRYYEFVDKSFRFTILGLWMFQIVGLINTYFLLGLYKTFKPDRYYMIFNVSSVVIHPVIILGFFTFSYTSKMINTRYAIIAFALVFVLIKSSADFMIMRFRKNEVTVDLDIYQI